MQRKISLTILSLIFILVCYSCNNQNGTNQQANETDKLVNSSGASASPEYREGARLLAANDCLTCHNIEMKMMGPSYREIARRYHNDQKYADFLSQSVARGSKGAWGNAEMPAHPQVPFDDIRQMTRYILSISSQNPQ